ncbi:hypothetical protein [[Erwinia] mediterraneensis]|uniref:hypothetical protein n=1 Tax=[Erwinia] mediterraneensis TaxID=2161819 RepID=UPI00103056F5|nr:hypothetical protein [[Erwinia] mediterraneensis]
MGRDFAFKSKISPIKSIQPGVWFPAPENAIILHRIRVCTTPGDLIKKEVNKKFMPALSGLFFAHQQNKAIFIVV